MRIMGLDVGEKRIGIALSDPMGWTAQGHSVLQRKNNTSDFNELLKICRQYEVEKIVVGYPLNMNGTIGPKAIEMQKFADILQDKCQMPVELWDERLSTRSAERTLLEADLSRKKRKQVIDKVAAVNILQAYLNSTG
ncbi:MAG TPA: Holliday junction resolvase RuvX [Syntrophomonadaceae bacterium]|nr:Holliday junction resolvase RuvX [Syntrophomonadaceae bacterium]HNX27867.1 Holliday junction resolvase RuvX [Syntrophomonadaceae bacterium]HPR93143.1 Holliday junction resolvase RuvX [Syntrophomonadaceae bacterium]